MWDVEGTAAVDNKHKDENVQMEYFGAVGFDFIWN